MQEFRFTQGPIMKLLRFCALLFLCMAVIPAFAASQKPATGRDLLFQLEGEFAKAVAQHGHAAFVTYFAEDGVELEDGGGASTREDIRKQPAWPEGTTLTWTPVRGYMAASGDLGYTYGSYVFTSKDKDGKMVPSYGKYMSVWRKQKDGSWKVVVDMGNSSPPPK
jgi:ketosteroid isomerase-like protein